jgi:hypothetical protein
MYVDAVDHKPPGIAWLYAGAFRVGGLYDLRWIRVMLAATVALTGIAVAELAAGLIGSPLARVAGLLYVVLSATGFAPNTQAANTELFSNFPLTLAALAMLKQSRARGPANASLWALLAGVATTAATLLRYQVAIVGAAWLLSLFLPRRAPHPLGAAAGLAMGFGAAAGALVAGFWLSGHLDDFLFWGWRYNFQYIASLPMRQQLIRLVIGSTPVVAAWLPAIVLLGWARRKAATMAWLWLAAMCAAVSIGGRFFGNYFLIVAPPLAVLAGVGVTTLDESHRHRWLFALTAAVAALAVTSTLAVIVWDRMDPTPARVDAAYRDAGGWIAAHSTPEERIFVWGDSAQLYVYSRRLMATRFAFTNYHTGIIWGTNAFPGSAHPASPSLVVPRAWSELLDDMARKPPALIADAAAGALHDFDGQELERYPQLWDIIRAHYRYETTRAGIRIYRRDRP